ncbi:MAG: acyloxyacyl hydrolase [Leadbetterella sp.]|nr:acyloxyacyl hydrolase [Leadbetterella sp.]
MIGSKRNVFIDLALRTQYRFHPKWKAGVGFAFHHFSNGALSLPNKGINLVPVTVSVNYQPRAFVPYTRAALPSYNQKIVFDISYGAGVKQLDKNSGARYFKTTLGLYASKHISYKWRLGAGYDLFYSGSGEFKAVAGDRAGKLGSVLSGGPSFYIVHVLNNRLTLNGNIGHYLHNQHFNGEIKRVFLRAGARYYLYKDLNAGVSIKAHAGKADFIEWTLGYTLNRN